MPLPKDQKELFRQAWETSPGKNCEVCGKFITTPLAWCFAHRLPKGTWPEFKLVPANISLVCGPECHARIDAQRHEMTHAWRQANEDWLRCMAPEAPRGKTRS
jgi:hypothetical protein